jgi:DNA polymerase III epsilon subunit-like protein
MVQLGAALMERNRSNSAVGEYRFKPVRDNWSTGAMRVNGLCPVSVQDYPTLQEELPTAISDLRCVCPAALIANQNVGFDVSFIEASIRDLTGPELDATWRTWKAFDFHRVDLFSVAFYSAALNIIARAPRGLGDLCDLLGIPREPNPHSALNGAMASARCMSELLMRGELR